MGIYPWLCYISRRNRDLVESRDLIEIPGFARDSEICWGSRSLLEIDKSGTTLYRVVSELQTVT
eukprot:68369-Amorphochlora_amoeboformis.AAC.1